MQKNQLPQPQNISSSTVSDTSQLRYQKAVKQISKLISMNNTVKRDAQKLKTFCDHLQIQNTQLTQNLSQATNQKNTLLIQIQSYQIKLHQLEKHLDNLQNQPQLPSQTHLEQEHNKSNIQLQNYKQKLNEQGTIIIHLEQIITDLQQKNKQLKYQNNQLDTQLKKFQSIPIQTINLNNCIKCLQINKKIIDAFQWQQKIQQQNIDLKKKIMFSQTRNHQPKPNIRLGRDYKDYLIQTLQDKVRLLEETNKRRRIESEKKDRKLQKLQNQKQKVKYIQTHTLTNQN